MIGKLVKILRSKPENGWHSFRVPQIGEVVVHCLPLEFAKANKYAEVWARIPTGNLSFREFRGSAEEVARRICLEFLKPPSKKVELAVSMVRNSEFDGMRPPEVAAMLDLDDEVTFKAFDFLAKCGEVENRNELGWFRSA